MNFGDLFHQAFSTVGEQFAEMSPLEVFGACLSILVALYSFVQLGLITRQDTIRQRLSALRRQTAAAPTKGARLDTSSASAPPWYDRLGAFIATTMLVGPADRSRLARVLSDAGFRGGKYRVATLVAIKLGLGAGVLLAAWFAVTIYGLFANVAVVRFVALLGALLVGWRIPDFILGRIASRRKLNIERSLPDALDLLVISAEAGLSLEQGIDFVAREMAAVMPELGEEFSFTSAELKVLGDRRQALQNLAERINLQSVRSIVSTLSQTMRYGTPLADSLRLLASEMRTTRMLKMEERAARMPVLLTMPLVLFILPSLMMVVGGPALLKVADAFKVLAK